MGILKLSEASVLGLHALIYIAQHSERKVSTREIADYHNASEAHLAKVMQRLVKAGLIISTRGPGGGFSLGKASDDITIQDVYEVFEGPLALTTCLFDQPVCSMQACIFHDLLNEVNQLVERYFTHMTITDAVERTKMTTVKGS